MKTTTKDEDNAKRTHELVLTDTNFDSEASEGLVLIDFWAPRCPPCRAQGPIVDRVAAAIKGKATVAKCDVDKAPKSAERFSVKSIPVLVIMKDNRELDRFVGLQQEADLIAALKRHIE